MICAYLPVSKWNIDHRATTMSASPIGTTKTRASKAADSGWDGCIRPVAEPHTSVSGRGGVCGHKANRIGGAFARVAGELKASICERGDTVAAMQIASVFEEIY